MSGHPCKVKICGITNNIDALHAVDSGADALGFVFYKKSPRSISPNTVESIVANLPPSVLSVGVFVNEDASLIQNIMDNCGLTFAQIHGDETPLFCKDLNRPLLRGIQLRGQETFLTLTQYKNIPSVHGFVLDAFSKNLYGGSGQTANWDLAAEVAKSFTFWLAGGLAPDNVKTAIEKVIPYGVDVSTGVESSAGKKDPAKVKAFIKTAKLVFAPLH